MRATLADVAKKTGLSTATIRQIFNGRAERFSKKTVERVRAAARELGYMPNAAARSVRRGRFDAVAVLLRHNGSHQDYNILKGVYAAATRRGWQVYYGETEDCGFDEPENVPRHFRERCVDGYLVHHGMDLDPALIGALERVGVPIVWINAQARSNCVRPDDEGAMEMAIDYLLAQGHHRLGWLCAEIDRGALWQYPFMRHYSSTLRLTCFRELCRKKGVAFSVFHEMFSDEDELTRGVMHWLAGSESPSAIITNGDVFNPHLLLNARHLGIDLPDLPEVVSFVTGPCAAIAGVRKTILRVPAQEMGQAGVDMLFELLSTDRSSVPPRLIPYTLRSLQ